MGKRKHPSFGRSMTERGLDQFDTPPIALAPLFEEERTRHVKYQQL
jgi:hypothetical protein